MYITADEQEHKRRGRLAALIKRSHHCDAAPSPSLCHEGGRNTGPSFAIPPFLRPSLLRPRQKSPLSQPVSQSATQVENPWSDGDYLSQHSTTEKRRFGRGGRGGGRRCVVRSETRLSNLGIRGTAFSLRRGHSGGGNSDRLPAWRSLGGSNALPCFRGLAATYRGTRLLHRTRKANPSQTRIVHFAQFSFVPRCLSPSLSLSRTSLTPLTTL